MAARGKNLSQKLARALTRRKKLVREYERAAVGTAKRLSAIEKIKQLDSYIGPERKKIADRERDVLQAKERAKELRQYVEGYEASDGYDLRRPKRFSKKQRARIVRDWQKLVPVLARPHVKARPRQTHEREDIKTLAEFAGLKSLPKGIKAIPVVTFAGDRVKTRVRIDASGEVVKHRGAARERYYLFNRQEKALIKKTGRVDAAVKSLLARMPAGRYFGVTGEAEAFQNALSYGGPGAPDYQNKVMQQVNRWIDEYPEDVEFWLRGFRWIGTLADDEAGRRERKRIIKARDKRQRERRARRDELAERARERAARVIPKK